MKKIILLKVLLGGISILSLTACLNTKPQYPYGKGIANYLYNVHKIQLDTITNKVFYFLPISECASCYSTDLNLKMLSKLKVKNLTLILIGQQSNHTFKTLLDNLNNTSLIDKKSEIYNYETGVLKPLLLHVKSGNIVYFLNVSDFKIDEAEKFLKQYE